MAARSRRCTGAVHEGIPAADRRRRRIVAPFIAAILLSAAAGGRAEEITRNILVLNSYQAGVEYTDLQVRAIAERLKASDAPPVTLYLEYLGANVSGDPQQQQLFAHVLERRYEGRRIDLIITTDTPAVDFMNQFGTNLFPGVPLVFSGLIFDHAGFVGPDREFTGVRERIEIRETIELILRLHPATRRIAFLCDATGFGLRLKRIARAAEQEFAGRLRFEWIEGLPFEQLRKRLGGLDSDTIPVFLSYSDEGLTDPPVDTMLARIAACSARPMYGLYDTTLGSGIVGGKMASAETQGLTAAELALRVLRGECASQIPPVTDNPNPFMFDWRELERWGIRRSILPAGSVIRFEPVSILTLHLPWIILGVILLLAEAVIIALLLVNRARRLRAESAVRRSDALVTSVFDSLPAHVAVLDATGRIVFVNAAWRRFAEENQFPGDDCGVGANYLHVCDRTDGNNAEAAGEMGRAIREVIAGRSADFRLVYPCPTAAGERWFQVRVNRLLTADGDEVRVLVAHEEITELQAAGRALDRSEERYRLLIEGSGVIAWEADPDTSDFTFVSARAEALLGFPLEAWYEPGFWVNRIHPDDREWVPRYSVERIARHEDHRFIYRMIAADGRVVWIEDFVSVVVRENRPIKLRGVMIDITDRKQAEERARESQSCLQQIAESIDQVFWMGSPDMREVYYVSPQYQRIWGRPCSSLLESRDFWSESIVPADRGAVLAVMARNLFGEGELEYRIQRPDGSIRWIRDRAFPVRNERGEVHRIAGIAEDVTSVKRAEALRKANYRVLEQIATGEPLPAILDSLVRLIESQGDGLIASILLLSEDGTRLLRGAAPSLPQEYNDAIDGVHIGPAVGSCGTAAFRGETVIVEDIEHDPLWAEYRELAGRFGLRACWSTPISSSEGRVLGTFALYYRTPRGPSEQELSLIQNAAHVASIAIERHRADKALRTSEERYRLLFEANMAGVFYSTLDGRICGCNDAFARILGYDSKEEAMAVPAVEFYRRPEDRERYLEKLRAERVLMDLEMELRRRDGSTLIVLENVRLLPGPHGEGDMIFGTLIDITQRKAAEQELLEARANLERRVRERTAELAESEERFRHLHEAASEGIAIFEAGRIIEANNALALMFGRSRQELIGMELIELIAPEARAAMYESLAAATAANPERPGESVGVRRDGQCFSIEYRGKEMPYKGRSVRVMVIRDISLRKQVEEQADQHREELAHVLRLGTLGEMATSLAHEINQPLAAIVNYTQGCILRLRAGNAPQEDILAAMQQATAQAQRASEIIRRIRDFVRKRDPLRAMIDLNAVIRRAIGLMEAETKRKSVAVRLALSQNLPLLPADEIQLEQVILNLLRNAVEALAEVPVSRRRVIIRSELNLADQVEVRVSDTGPGISRDIAGRMFDPFVTSKPHGMGMGLSISRSIVEAHGGRLWVTPNAQEGVTFHLALPVSEGKQAHEPARTQADGVYR